MKKIQASLLFILFFFLLQPAFAVGEDSILPGNLFMIEDEAFEGTAIENIDIPLGTTYIGKRAFANSQIARINIPNTVTTIEDDAFYDIPSITIVCDEGSVADNYAFNRQWPTEYGNGRLRAYPGSLVVPVNGETRLLRFTSPVSDIITVYSSGDSDTIGYLYDEGLHELTSNDDGEDLNFKFTYNVIQGLTYYIGVRYYDETYSGDISVTISMPALSIVLNPDEILLEEGHSASIKPEVFSISSDYTINWTSSNPTVATVENGIVTAVSKGISTITATIISGEETASASIYISVFGAETYAAELTYEGHIYRLYEDGYSWGSADKYCKNLGGHLATITSEAEQNAIWEMIILAGNKNNYWIGGFRENGIWYWVTGESFSSYTKWSPYQPDNAWIGEDSLEIYRNQNPHDPESQAGYWNDLNYLARCYDDEFDFFGLDHFGFICEWEDD